MSATTLTDRAILRLSGEDVRGFLQGLITSDVSKDLPIWTGLLTPQGKCLFDFLVWADGDDLLIDCEAAQSDALAKRLTLYRLRRPITISRDDSIAVHWAAQGGDDGTPDPRLSDLGQRWLAPADGPASGWAGHRLRLGVCEGHAELSDLLWLECNAAELNGVSFTKGCFVGQENTARMNWRQKVNRRLLVVEGDGGDRVRVAYPDLGLSVVHARVDAIPENAIIPDWLSESRDE
nr:folate-binding protein [uncultured Sphingomonas sp.]